MTDIAVSVFNQKACGTVGFVGISHKITVTFTVAVRLLPAESESVGENINHIRIANGSIEPAVEIAENIRTILLHKRPYRTGFVTVKGIKVPVKVNMVCSISAE